jgi:hypothetical protein
MKKEDVKISLMAVVQSLWQRNEKYMLWFMSDRVSDTAMQVRF